MESISKYNQSLYENESGSFKYFPSANGHCSPLSRGRWGVGAGGGGGFLVSVSSQVGLCNTPTCLVLSSGQQLPAAPPCGVGSRAPLGKCLQISSLAQHDFSTLSKPVLSLKALGEQVPLTGFCLSLEAIIASYIFYMDSLDLSLYSPSRSHTTPIL